MDSITQAALGAIVGEAVAGKRIGNRALILGAVIATIPDLDIVLLMFTTDELTKLLMHRGFSHSFIVMSIFSLVIASTMWFFKKEIFGLSPWIWFQLLFWCFVTHILLDLFTSFGTQIFNPVNDTRYAVSSIFIVDLFYTLPLLIGIILLLFKTDFSARKKISTLVLVISSIYLIVGITTKLLVYDIFTNTQDKEIAAHQVEVMATPISFLLWRVIVKDKNQYKTTYFSVLNTEKELEYQRIEFHPDRVLLNYLIREKKYFFQLMRFSKGFYSYSEDNGKIYFSDIRLSSGDISPFQFQVAYRDSGGGIKALSSAKRIKTYGRIKIKEALSRLIEKL